MVLVIYFALLSLNYNFNMISIKPFKGYRPPNNSAENIAAVPYDVINKAEAQQLAKGNPQSFLHITRSEIDLPPGADVYSQKVYDKARSNFLAFIENGWLVKDEQDSIYLYQQTMGNHTQTGILALSSIEDYFEDRIKKHEFTRPKKEKDRINNMKTLGAHAGPVFLTYKNVAEISQFVNDYTNNNKPEVDFTAVDNIKHKLWCVTDGFLIETLTNLFKEKVPASYIADGHHRAASSAKVGEMLKQENPNHSGNEAYNYFLSVLFPDNEMKILDYNRLVKDLNGLSTEAFLKKIEAGFEIQPNGSEIYKPSQPRTFGLYIGKQWYQLTAKPHTYDENDPIAALDITTLSNHLLDKILNIKDQRTDERVDFVGGIRGLEELEKRVNTGDWKMAIALYPVSIQQLINIADSGEVMPPKSTWFEPKLRSGLVVHRFDE